MIDIFAEFDYDVNMDIGDPELLNAPVDVTAAWVEGWPSCWGGRIRLTNLGSESYVVFPDELQVSGWPLDNGSFTQVEAYDQTLIDDYEEREYTVDNEFIQSTEHAGALADALLEVYKDPAQRLDLKMPSRGLPFLKLGQCIRVTNTKASINEAYWITRHTLSFDGSLSGVLTLLRAGSE